MTPKEIKQKRPWTRPIPMGYLSMAHAYAGKDPEDEVATITVTQADFLREYNPTSHMVNDPAAYPDIYRKETVTDEQGNEHDMVYKEEVPRKAYAFQQVITTKRLCHLTGNDIRFELNRPNATQGQEQTFAEFRAGWLKKDMEVAFHDFVKSVYITADAAFIGWLDNGSFGWDIWSYETGSRIFPHYDTHGRLILIAREYHAYDEQGGVTTEFLEVYDQTTHYILKRDPNAQEGVKRLLAKLFKADGYSLVHSEPHGFPFCPAAYHRNEYGPVWAFSQETSDAYELAASQLSQNNKAYGEPILTLQSEGDSIDIAHGINGTIKMLSMGREDKAQYLQGQSASESFMRELDNDRDMIYEQSFAVMPPEMKSGDLPAAALKILYSPAVEKAMEEANEYHKPLARMVDVFRYGYGIEAGMTLDFASLDVKFWIEPYVHLNTSATINDLSVAVQNRFLSRKTASEVATFYATENEWERLAREEKEQQEADIIYGQTVAASAKQ